ncbi:hypothetical protein KTD22_11635 [Burkholderia multivorans]|uniref:hypothetical protein n=1 Tax=Burkholderia multivorans TaxID=87883 RepID=UPI001DBE0ABB|nr:hypothetical protein [Burkholderia multivorans]MBU9227282.1 hypothetical protein [Burkholderia multivorans]
MKYEVHVVEQDGSSWIVRRCNNKAEAIRYAKEAGEYNGATVEVWAQGGILVFSLPRA